MNIFNPVDKFITLHDGSRVSKKFYETVKQHVEDRYKYLNSDNNHSIANILGDDFLILLSESESIKAFKSFIHMVEKFQVSYVTSDVPSLYFDYFELIPTMPPMADELPF
jgi:hypothetical protein